MKLQFFVDTYRPYISGVVTAVDTMTTHLRARGHEVTINAPAYPEEPEPPSDPHVRRIPSLPFPGYEGLRIAAPLPFQLAASERFDIVHAHHPFSMGLAAVSLAREHKVPMVYSCHSLYPDYSEYVPWASTAVRRVLEAHLQYFCNRCDATIVPTEHVRTKLVDWGVETPIYTIPTGIELEPFQKYSHTEARRWLLEEHSIPKDRFLLLFVGRLAQEKNLEHLLSELVRLRTLEGEPKDRDVHLVVVGEGPHEETLVERVDEQRLTDNVTFAGTVSWEQVTRYYRGADTFAFPGVSETQGIVLVEALAAGLPIVALSSPATREIVRSGVEGLLVSDRQGALARALEQLKTSSRMQRLFSEAASSRAERFAASQTAAQVEELYREIKTDFKPRRNLGETALALFQGDGWEPSNDK